jgi:hypothetical protein
MSAQFAIKSLHCITHNTEAGCRFDCNGCVFLGKKSKFPKQGVTSALHLFASMTVRLACTREFRKQMQLILFGIFLTLRNPKRSKASRVLCAKTATFRPGQ